MTDAASACFHEVDTGVALPRRAAAEGLGTLMLVFTASAVGIAASRLLPGYPGAAVVLSAFAIAGALASLIVAFGKLSGGHYNPLITIAQLLAGERSPGCAIAYVVCQLAGGLAGGALAAAIWQGLPPFTGGLGISGITSEFVASAGLLLVALGASRSGRAETGPFAVGVWVMAAIIATPTASYANPAVVLGAMATAGPMALGGESAVAYVGAEMAGALLALGVVSILFPNKQAMP